MTDYFALLQLERLPWLESEEVKSRFQELSRTHHPDAHVASDAADRKQDKFFAELTQAHRTLSHPKLRIKHLLELEYPESIATLSTPRAVPRELGDQVFAIQELLFKVKLFTDKKAATQNALAKALLAREEYELREGIEAHLAELNTAQAQCFEVLKKLNAAYKEKRSELSQTLTELYIRLGYLTRWIEQLQEVLFKI